MSEQIYESAYECLITAYENALHKPKRDLVERLNGGLE